MKITKDDVGKRIWSYLDQKWYIIDDCEQNHPDSDSELTFSAIEVLNQHIKKCFDNNGCLYFDNQLPVFFWQEIKPIEHKERPMKIVRVQKGIVIYRDRNDDIFESIKSYTKKELEQVHGKGLKFICFAPDKEILEVEEEVEE